MQLSKNRPEEANLIARIFVEVGLPLKKRLVEERKKRGVGINQIIAEVLAEHFGDESLSYIPREIRGRKPTLTVKR